jgi:thymidylate synthase (FAD)
MNHEDENKTIYLYGDGIGKVQLIESYGSDKSVVNSARVSFGQHKEELDERDKKLINYLIKHRHTSTLEHCGITFKFVVPLYIRSQHHRHRTWSYNEISRRYTDVDLRFYEPKAFRTQHKSNRQASNAEELINPETNTEAFFMCGYVTGDWNPTAAEVVKRHNENSLFLYEELIEKGVCREQARGVLPQNLYTEYYGTCSLLNALKFISLRSHEGAQWEIQKVAEAMLGILEDLYPVTIAAYKENEE